MPHRKIARDERMSWGLQFYEQQELVHRAHFPEVYNNTENNEEEDEESKEVVDWKYEHPRHLSGMQRGKSGGDVIDEDEDFSASQLEEEDNEEEYGQEEEEEEDDYRFLKPGQRDVFHEQRMFQDKIASRPERLTFQEEVERSSYQASVNSSLRHETSSNAAEEDVAIAIAK